LSPYCLTGPRIGLPHERRLDSPGPERGTITGVCKFCGDVRTYPKSVYAKGKASSEQAQQRLRRTLGKR
jgi:hypothetical protein